MKKLLFAAIGLVALAACKAGVMGALVADLEDGRIVLVFVGRAQTIDMMEDGLKIKVIDYRIGVDS